MTIKKIGRPKKPEAEKLIKHSYSLNQTEAKALRDRCKQLNIPLAIYVRQLIAIDTGLGSKGNDQKQ